MLTVLQLTLAILYCPAIHNSSMTKNILYWGYGLFCLYALGGWSSHFVNLTLVSDVAFTLHKYVDGNIAKSAQKILASHITFIASHLFHGISAMLLLATSYLLDGYFIEAINYVRPYSLLCVVIGI